MKKNWTASFCCILTIINANVHVVQRYEANDHDDQEEILDGNVSHPNDEKEFFFRESQSVFPTLDIHGSQKFIEMENLQNWVKFLNFQQSW